MWAVFRYHRALPFLAGVVCLHGCGKTSPQFGSRLTVPAPDRVRIVYTRLSADNQRIHAKWSIIGGKNWDLPVAANLSLGLTGGYPLNAPMRQGGCHTWEFDLDAEKIDGQWKWKTIVHGSNGKTAGSQGTAAKIDLLLQSDSEERLPCQLDLARIDNTPLTLTVPK
jgi:hypothetical protein